MSLRGHASFARIREPRKPPAAKGAKDVTRRYEHEIVFLHSDEDHVTMSHFRRNYLCPVLRAATRRDATRLRHAGPIAFPVTQR